MPWAKTWFSIRESEVSDTLMLFWKSTHNVASMYAVVMCIMWWSTHNAAMYAVVMCSNV